jgi:hypothetical protein
MRTQEQRSLVITILLGLVVVLTIVLAVGIRQPAAGPRWTAARS